MIAILSTWRRIKLKEQTALETLARYLEVVVPENYLEPTRRNRLVYETAA
jgi:hypothetical protein